MNIRQYIDLFEKTQKYCRQYDSIFQTVNRMNQITNQLEYIGQNRLLGWINQMESIANLGVFSEIALKQNLYNTHLFKINDSITKMNINQINSVNLLYTKYTDTIYNYIIRLNNLNITLPSNEIINSTLEKELQEAGFYSPELSIEEKLQVIDDKIHETEDKPEWVTAVLVWFLATLINYIILISINYNITGELQLLPPSIDTTMFISYLLKKKNDQYRYVKIENLEVKEIARHRSKTIGYLSKEQEVKVLRKRKDWSLVEYNNADKVATGWVLTRYLEK
jgi:Bacterial SH3 domain